MQAVYKREEPSLLSQNPVTFFSPPEPIKYTPFSSMFASSDYI